MNYKCKTCGLIFCKLELSDFHTGRFVYHFHEIPGEGEEGVIIN